MLKFFSSKTFLILVLLINIGLPINNLYNFCFIVIGFVLIILNEIKKKKKSFTYFIIFLTIINLAFLKNNKIDEAHSAFITKSDISVIDTFLPKQLIDKLSNDLEKFDYDRYFEGRQSPAGDKFFIQDPYAFSADSFFQKNKYTRTVYNIDTKNRADQRMGQFNTRKFAMPYDQDLKENFPYYALYELGNSFKNSKICGSGNVFISSTNIIGDNLKLLNFEELKNIKDVDNCYKLKNENYFIFAYSIGDYDNFNLKLEKNKILQLKNNLKIFIYLLIIISLLFMINFKDKVNLYLIAISILSSFILAYFNDPNVIFALRHVYGGSDGLIFSSFASSIVQNLSNGDLYQAFRGEEDIFYFQPGLRYYNAIFKVIFGETNFGYLITVSIFPFIIFLLFKKITTIKISYTLFFLFVFFPIFESIGFGHFNYVRQAIRLHAESLAILLLIYCIYVIFKNEYKNNINLKHLILIGLILSQVIFLRPNFAPSCLLISFYLIFENLRKKELLNILIFSFSLSFSFLCLVHNLYFGNQFVLFSSASVHILFTKDFSEFNFTEANNFWHLLLIQLRDWNDIAYFPRLIFLFFVLYNIKKYNYKNFIFWLILCCLSQHIVLLLTHASSRYAYLAWLLTFILFIKISYDQDVWEKTKKLIFFKNRKIF